MFASVCGPVNAHDQATFGILAPRRRRQPILGDILETRAIVAVPRGVGRVELQPRRCNHGWVMRQGGLRQGREAQHRYTEQVEKSATIFRDEARLVPCPCMSRRQVHQPVDKAAKEAVRPSHQRPNLVKPFGLSDEQFARVTRAMRAVATLVCRHSGVSPKDAVQQAWLKALSKPETEMPSSDDFDKLLICMCGFAKYEAMTNRQSYRRRQGREIGPDVDIDEMVAVSDFLEVLEARMTLEGPFLALEPAEQELLHALYHEGKTIAEIKQEQGLAWSTLDSRRQKLLERLYALIRAMVAALLLVPKKARAFVANVAQQLPQLASTMAVTAVCGVLVPTGSSFATEPSMTLGLTEVGSKQTNPAESAVLPASFVPEVVPEELKTLDTGTNMCSPGDMKYPKFASMLQEAVVPLTFVAATGVTQVACAGSNPQMPPAQQAEEERDDSHDPYEMYRVKARGRGETVMTREEWERPIRDR